MNFPEKDKTSCQMCLLSFALVTLVSLIIYLISTQTEEDVDTHTGKTTTTKPDAIPHTEEPYIIDQASENNLLGDAPEIVAN